MAKSKKKKKAAASDDPKNRSVCRNRRASHEYELIEEYECGVQLRGSEVKSIRNGKISIEEAYARITDGEVFLVGADIAEYPQATVMNHEPTRPRKLLLHRREIGKLQVATDQQGMTLIPTAVYFKEGRIKVRIAVAKGRKLHDKREKLRERDDTRAMRQAKMVDRRS